MSDGASLRADGEANPAERELPVWRPLIDRVRQAVVDDDDAALIAMDEEMAAMQERPRREIRRGLPLLALYRSLVAWKRDGTFVVPFTDAQVARIQNWELDEYCPDIAYRRTYIDSAVEAYPDLRGFRLFKRILGTISNSRSRIKVTKADVQVHPGPPDAPMTIVAFGGVNGGFVGTGWPLFERAVAAPMNANFILLRDNNMRNYLAGIQSLGDYDTTIVKLREILVEFSNTRIVAIGGSAGVFGAINYSTDLGIRHVVAFAGPTSVEVGETMADRQVYRLIREDLDAGRFKNVDLPEKVNNSAIERIDFFVAGRHAFDMAQMEALRSRSAKVVPHIYADLETHAVTDYAIEDRSLFDAFNAGPQTPGLG